MRAPNGFTLIEAVVASALLLLACLAVTGTVLSAVNAGRVLEQRVLLEHLVQTERVRLAVLPFAVRAVSPGAETQGQPSPSSLVGEVFPHAGAARNTAEAWIADRGGEAVFHTTATREGVSLEREARFVRLDGSEWSGLPMAALNDWAIWEARVPPATMLEVVMRASAGGRTATCSLLRSALTPSFGEPLDSGGL